MLRAIGPRANEPSQMKKRAGPKVYWKEESTKMPIHFSAYNIPRHLPLPSGIINSPVISSTISTLAWDGSPSNGPASGGRGGALLMVNSQENKIFEIGEWGRIQSFKLTRFKLKSNEFQTGRLHLKCRARL